jgi:hypothetical protein
MNSPIARKAAPISVQVLHGWKCHCANFFGFGTLPRIWWACTCIQGCVWSTRDCHSQWPPNRLTSVAAAPNRQAGWPQTMLDIQTTVIVFHCSFPLYSLLMSSWPWLRILAAMPWNVYSKDLAYQSECVFKGLCARKVLELLWLVVCSCFVLCVCNISILVWRCIFPPCSGVAIGTEGLNKLIVWLIE